MIITGKGFLDFTTKKFLKSLLQMNILIFFLSDFDVFGYEIFLDILFGSKMSIYENNNIPIVFRIGIDRNDVSLINKGKQELTKNEIIRLNKVLTREYF